MQDKPIHITKKMTDQGWREMSKLLDSEMPAPEKPNRRFGWWLLFLGLAIGLGSGIFIVKYFTRSELQPAEKSIPVAAASENGDKTAKNAIPSVDNAVAGQAAGTVAAESTSPVKTPQNTGRTPVIRNEKTQHNPARKAIALTELKESGTIVLSSGTPAEHSTENKSSAEVHTGYRELPSASNLAYLPVRPLEVSADELPEVDVLFPEVSNNSLVIYGSGLSSPANSAGGLAAGLLKTSDLKDSRFSLEGGIGYAYIQQPISVIFSSQPGSVSVNSTFTEFKTVLGDAEIANSVNASGNAAKLLKKLQLNYLEVPLAVNYRLTSRCNLKSGLNAGVLLSSSSDYTTGGIFSSSRNDNSLLMDEAEASFDYSGEEPSVRLNYFDLAASAGIDFKITNHIGAGIGYQFGLLDLIPDNGTGDFNRMMRISLRYTLAGGK